MKDCSGAVYLLKISKYRNQTKIYRFIFVISLQPKKPQKNRTNIHTFNYHLAAKKGETDKYRDGVVV